MRNRWQGFNRRGKIRLAWVGPWLVVCFACATPLLDQAWKGKLDSKTSNEVIVSYCQSCHTHKDVTEKQCLNDKPALYDRPPYNTARECRVCHFVEQEFWRPLHLARRQTRRPQEVREDRHVQFEKEILQELKERQESARSSTSDPKEEASSSPASAKGALKPSSRAGSPLRP